MVFYMFKKLFYLQHYYLALWHFPPMQMINNSETYQRLVSISITDSSGGAIADMARKYNASSWKVTSMQLIIIQPQQQYCINKDVHNGKYLHLLSRGDKIGLTLIRLRLRLFLCGLGY